MADRLTELALKYRTDKVATPGNIHSHNYIPAYNTILEGKQVRKVLEIGIGPQGLFHPEQLAGASLRMWAEYFPQAEIFGLDNNPATIFDEGRIHCFSCDQGNVNSLQGVLPYLGGKFDLIVDDGSHEPSHQILSAKVLLSLVSAGGIYVIEDVHDLGILNELPYACEVYRALKYTGAVDDYLVVFRR